MKSRAWWIFLPIVALAVTPLRGQEIADDTTELVTFELARSTVAADSTSLESEEISGLLILRALESSAEETSLELTSVRPSQLRLSAGTSWEVLTEVPGHWVQPHVLNVRADDANRLDLRAWPLGTLTGRLDLESDTAPLPGDLVVRSERPPLAWRGNDTPPAGRFPCQMDPDAPRQFECEVPIGRLDLGLYLDDHAPVYRWDLEVRRDEPLGLGTIRFVRGGSLSGWAVLAGAELEAGKGKVELRPALAPGPRAPVTERLAETAVATTIDQRGFFQVTGLAPGFYDLTASYPGFARFDLGRVEIPVPDEVRLDGVIELQRPFRVELAFEPVVDWRNRPWTVEIRRADSSGREQEEPLLHGAVTDGKVVLTDQTPGPLSIEIYDSLGNRFHYEPELWVHGDGDTRQTIFLETVIVEGRLSYGSTPLAGTAWFGGRHGSPRVRIETDETGRFTAALPEAGRWPIEVEAALPEDHDATTFGEEDDLTATLSVLVEDGEFLELEVPETLVFGWVTDATGQPVDEAQVLAYVDSVGHDTRTDRDGSFAVRGLPAGTVLLSAKHGSQRQGVSASATSTLDLVEGEPLGPVELSLEGKRSFALQVVSDRGPVPGATLYLYGHVPTSAYVGVGRSDPEGRVPIDVPESAQLLRVVIFAPGHGLRAELVDASRDEAILEVDRWSGTLDIDLGQTWEELYDRRQTVVIFQDGQPIPLGRLLDWGRAQGVSTRTDRGLSVPGLAPGTYQVCLGPAVAVASDRLDAWREDLPCAEGQLSGGGPLSLDLSP